MYDDDPEKIWIVIDKETNKLKHACFGKVKVKSETKEDKEIDKLQREKLESKDEDEITKINEDIIKVTTTI